MQHSEHGEPFAVDGQPVMDGQIQGWADEAEAGCDPALLRKGGRPRTGSTAATVATLRLDPELQSALDRRVEHEHSTRSAVMRDALRAWLATA